MRCGADANPPATYVWLKDGENLSNSNKFTITNRNSTTTLTIRDVSEDESGMYQCIAHNEYGYRFSYTKLNVIGKRYELEARKMSFTRPIAKGR